jgi:hypothetical protein
MWRHRHLAIGVDVRKGIRRIDGMDMDAARTTMPPPAEPTDKEHYTRGRVVALFYF